MHHVRQTATATGCRADSTRLRGAVPSLGQANAAGSWRSENCSRRVGCCYGRCANRRCCRQLWRAHACLALACLCSHLRGGAKLQAAAQVLLVWPREAGPGRN
ncbi:hypothetical protein DL89DRAFT_108618 [Linderina pennispora]|uniref:Uncharacterized protein n=1 Tax=Linderina pennispora TaxID=61395 RepID=A0A1Y1WF20_9FUNG|nr:uncharacterized protein DL89DRAFT_108618 [Linderina pennispora]ORX72130.1 hypothetical protein DL89DRAFT_108618 [Linderina pennispora]